MGLKQLVITASILVLIQAWCCDGCWEEERVAVLQLQASFNTSLFPLDNKRANCCDLYEIECDADTGRVTHLYLVGARDSDLGDLYLNASMFLPFKQLTYLDLSDNGLTGCLHNDGFERLTELSKLKYLDLRYNNFNNSILQSLSGLSSLKSLNISYNNLKESIDIEELASLKNLEELNMSGNKNISAFVVSKDVRAPANLNTIYLDDMTANGTLLLLKSLRAFSSFKTLSLQYNNLTESISLHEPQSFGSVENLYLDGSVVDENFFGNLDKLPSLKSLSFRLGHGLNNLRGLCKLNYLQYLDLSGNLLSGELPSCLSNLTSLQYFDLSGNLLAGNLSSSPLTLFTSIQYLGLEHNNFQIPISLVPFYNCSQLSYLDIWGNELYAETEWHSLFPKFQLRELYMHGDGCRGSFPRFLYNQHNLQRVYLNNFKMRGEFPHWLIENNSRLEDLSLSNNSLTGTIRLPSHSHVNLSILFISNNFFTGQIPTKFGSFFPNLKQLSMSHNELNGKFPSSIGNMSSLLDLDLSNNKLNGNFLPLTVNLNKLRYLDLSVNHMFGEMPKFFNCSSLKLFDISENKISGNLSMFSNCLNLEEVYLAKNKLHGSLAWAFSNSSSLNTLVVNHNFLRGTIQKWIKNLKDLMFLQLAHNYFEGQMPLEFGNFSTIKVLNLSRNSLRGSIPSTFSNLKEIETLDLSHNNLEGKIPSQLIQLNSISSFSVAYNNLSGRISNSVKQFATFENTSYEGNPFLCGKSLSKSCETIVPLSPLPRPSPNSEDEDGFMDARVFYVSFGVTYFMVLLGIVTVLYINPYWKRVWFYFIERMMTDCYYFIVDCSSFKFH